MTMQRITISCRHLYYDDEDDTLNLSMGDGVYLFYELRYGGESGPAEEIIWMEMPSRATMIWLADGQVNLFDKGYLTSCWSCGTRLPFGYEEGDIGLCEMCLKRLRGLGEEVT